MKGIENIMVSKGAYHYPPMIVYITCRNMHVETNYECVELNTNKVWICAKTNLITFTTLEMFQKMLYEWYLQAQKGKFKDKYETLLRGLND